MERRMISLRQASILVVDDSPTMRLLVTGMLQSLGAVHIDYADNGEAALSKIKGANTRRSCPIGTWSL